MSSTVDIHPRGKVRCYVIIQLLNVSDSAAGND